MATTITYTIDHGSDHPTNQSKTTQAKAKKLKTSKSEASSKFEVMSLRKYQN